MAVLRIPTSPGVPHYRQQTELDSAVYTFDFDWNAREGAWYLSIADIDGVPIRSGLRLVPNWPLLRNLRHTQRPPGELIVLDQRGAGITLDNLGVDVWLDYFDAAAMAEGAALAAAAASG